MPFASTGSPGRIGGVHIDAITAIRGPRAYLRTENAIESGAPISSHRQRVNVPLELDIVVSDAEPIAGAGLTPLWESGHARKTRERLIELMDRGAIVEVFDGSELWRTPAGSRVWVIDGIDDSRAPEDRPLPGLPETWRATIRIGEQPQFSTSFTPLAPNVDPSIQDQVDGVVDTGQQSTETVPGDIAASIPT